VSQHCSATERATIDQFALIAISMPNWSGFLEGGNGDVGPREPNQMAAVGHNHLLQFYDGQS